MKHLVRCSLLALGAAITLPAQISESQIKAKVPFEFTVQGRTMPAGDYVVNHTNSTATIILKCQEHSASVIVPTNALVSPLPHQQAKLVFHRYGDRYFLAEVC